ncbi:MAG: dynamin family protein [Pseudomonadota bacterium]
MILSRRKSEPLARDETASTASVGARKPRIMIAGEFSAGKTKLINGLIGHEVLPSNVTATSLPPIWLTSGQTGILSVGLNGEKAERSSLDDVDVEDTQFCVMALSAPILERFDIIDTPGNSDPNIDAESWERMLRYADLVVWCTNANQAWRQSEKSVWADMPSHLVGVGPLVITHADLLADEVTAERVVRRARREAGAYFASILMVSLLRDADIARVADALETLGGSIAESGEANLAVSRFAQAERAVSEDQTIHLGTIDAPPSPKVPKRVMSRRLESRDSAPDPLPEIQSEIQPEPQPLPEPEADAAFDPFEITSLDDEAPVTRPLYDIGAAPPPAEMPEQTGEAAQAAPISQDARVVNAVLEKLAVPSYVAQISGSSDDDLAKTKLLQPHKQPCRRAPGQSARDLWHDVIRGKDLNDADVVLACAEALIRQIDAEDDLVHNGSNAVDDYGEPLSLMQPSNHGGSHENRT